MIDSALNTPDEEAAKAILTTVRGTPHYKIGRYHWVLADGVLAAVAAYRADPFIRGAHRSHPWINEWYEMASKVGWRPQMVHEFQQMDQGIIPGTIGVQPWLLPFAISTSRVALVEALVDQDVPFHARLWGEAADNDAARELLPMLLKKVSIQKEALRYLTSAKALCYSLPYLSEFSTILAEHCLVKNLRNLKENGFDISDHNNMIRAMRSPVWPRETMVYLRDNTDTSPDVLETARESAWYWVLYASDDERQALLEQSGSWAPLIEMVLQDRAAGEQDLHGDFADLVRLPVGMARRILFLCQELRTFPTVALPWPNNELRDLLVRKGELANRPWLQLF